MGTARNLTLYLSERLISMGEDWRKKIGKNCEIQQNSDRNVKERSGTTNRDNIRLFRGFRATKRVEFRLRKTIVNREKDDCREPLIFLIFLQINMISFQQFHWSDVNNKAVKYYCNKLISFPTCSGLTWMWSAAGTGGEWTSTSHSTWVHRYTSYHANPVMLLGQKLRAFCVRQLKVVKVALSWTHVSNLQK